MQSENRHLPPVTDDNTHQNHNYYNKNKYACTNQPPQYVVILSHQIHLWLK